MIKKYWIYLFFGFSLCFFIYTQINRPKNKNSKNDIVLKPIAIGSKGWGFEIYLQDKLFIKQQTIPVVEGTQYFTNKEQALLVGKLMITKMLSKKGLPTITLKELDSLKIIRK